MDRWETEKYWAELPPEEQAKIRWRFYGYTCEHDWDKGPYDNAMDAIPILDHGYVALLDHMGTDIDIVNAARISFNRESSSLDDRDRKLLRYLWEHQHTSPFEMVEFKFIVKCPIFVARQWMRHRTWSYNEVSRRYTEDEIEFYIPDKDWLRQQSDNDRQASVEADENLDSLMAWLRIVGSRDRSYETYDDLLRDGLCREQSRMVLSLNMYTTFIAKVDLANLLHFIDLRFDPHAQWEIQQYGEAIAEMIGNIVPETMNVFMEKRNEHS